jgi:hypothetical protein
MTIEDRGVDVDDEWPTQLIVSRVAYERLCAIEAAARALGDSWESSARQLGERTLLGDSAASIATVNTLRSCATALRAALSEPADDPKGT